MLKKLLVAATLSLFALTAYVGPASACPCSGNKVAKEKPPSCDWKAPKKTAKKNPKKKAPRKKGKRG